MTTLSPRLDWSLANPKWAAALNPVLANPLTNATILTGIKLSTGVNVINTTIGRQTQGWFIADINAAVTIYRSAPFTPLTLTLTSSGPAVVDIVVF